MLLTRVITAAVLLAVLVGSLIAGQAVYFQLLLLIFGAAAFWEWFRLMRLESLKAGVLAIIAVAAGVVLTRLGGSTGFLVLCGSAAIVWIAVVLPTLWGRLMPKEGVDTQTAMLGVVIIGAAVLAANHAFVRFGAVFLISLLAIVFIADIAAYFVGKRIGKHKLAPSISPGKTWEGAIGGVAAVIAYGTACIAFDAAWMQQTFPAVLAARWGTVLALTMLAGLAALSVVGDLFESMLKRRVGVKDSSQLLPGHGGVLDRIDAQLPVLPSAILLTWGIV
jgi:phosphatidate cytidylyltransferase